MVAEQNSRTKCTDKGHSQWKTLVLISNSRLSICLRASCLLTLTSFTASVQWRLSQRAIVAILLKLSPPHNGIRYQKPRRSILYSWIGKFRSTKCSIVPDLFGWNCRRVVKLQIQFIQEAMECWYFHSTVSLVLPTYWCQYVLLLQLYIARFGLPFFLRIAGVCLSPLHSSKNIQPCSFCTTPRWNEILNAFSVYTHRVDAR